MQIPFGQPGEASNMEMQTETQNDQLAVETNIDVLREPFYLKSVDVRNILKVAPATLNEIYKKNDIQYVSEPNARGTGKHVTPTDARRLFEARGYSYPSQAKVISLMMCKGGVGKTTSTFYLGQRLSSLGAKVLVIDADSQGNLSEAFALDRYGFDFDEETPILVDVVADRIDIDEAILAVTPNLHLVPSNPLNSTLEATIRDRFKNYSRPVKDILAPLRDRYDYILIDCAPALNLTNTAIMCASDQVILPVAPDKFSQVGLDQTIGEIESISRDFAVDIDYKIVFTRFDAREYTSLTYLSDIAGNRRDRMFKTMVRVAADVKNAITKREDLFEYRKSNAREDYDSFARELMGLTDFFEKKSENKKG